MRSRSLGALCAMAAAFLALLSFAFAALAQMPELLKDLRASKKH